MDQAQHNPSVKLVSIQSHEVSLNFYFDCIFKSGTLV